MTNAEFLVIAANTERAPRMTIHLKARTARTKSRARAATTSCTAATATTRSTGATATTSCVGGDGHDAMTGGLGNDSFFIDNDDYSSSQFESIIEVAGQGTGPGIFLGVLHPPAGRFD